MFNIDDFLREMSRLCGDFYRFIQMLREGGRAGEQAAMRTFEASRPGVAAMAVGVSRAAAEYAAQRVQFGRPIGQNQAVAFMLASGGPYAAGIVDGPLSAFSDQSGTLPAPFGMAQGVFGVPGSDPTVCMPGQGSDSANFWMDLQVTDTAPADASFPPRTMTMTLSRPSARSSC
jgi:hypothetical protein